MISIFNSKLLLINIFSYLIFWHTNIYSQKISNDNAKPKNIILMISDGCGYNHILATNYYQYGYENAQKYEQFPVKLAVSTYPAWHTKDTIKSALYGYNPYLAWKDGKYEKTAYTNSAAAATAMGTGKKTYNNAIGVDINKNPILNLTEYTHSIGKKSGVVTTVQFCHATPAGFTAHNKSRQNYGEIAYDMVFNSYCNVIMGAGHPYYDDNSQPVKTPNYKYIGDSLLWTFLQKSNNSTLTTPQKSHTCKDVNFDKVPDAWQLITTKNEFQNLTTTTAQNRIIGIPQVNTTLQQYRKRNDTLLPFSDKLNANVPSLAEMSLGALQVLNNDNKGFFLLIEGGAVDWAAHDNQSERMIEEQIDFNIATDSVISWIEKYSSWDETLLIITSDHETGMLWGDSLQKTPYKPIQNNGKGHPPLMVWNSDDHTNSLIPIFAKGKGSEWFTFFADEYDFKKGYYLNNTEIAQLIFLLWQNNHK